MIKNMIDSIVSEAINDCLRGKGIINEYKNPKDSNTIRVCADQLEALYENIIANGASRNEYTLQRLFKVIRELRKIQKTIR